jgi:hypothetical protein
MQGESLVKGISLVDKGCLTASGRPRAVLYKVLEHHIRAVALL